VFYLAKKEKRVFSGTFQEEQPRIKKDLAFKYLYIYHTNYELETAENRRKIREYYDKELRYKNAFYRDRRYFKTHGNPDNWTKERKNRFKIATYQPSFDRGTKLFSEFRLEKDKLVNLDLNRDVSIVIIDTDYSKEEIELHPYEEKVRRELSKLKNLMLTRIDNKKHKVRIKKGNDPFYDYDLSRMQIIFQLQINKHIRITSTKFVIPQFVIELGISVLNGYVRQLIDLEKGLGREEFTKPSNPPDFPIEIYYLELQKISLVKRTDIYSVGLERKVNYPYNLDQSFLTSLVII